MTDHAEKAHEIIARHYREVEQIRADQRFSDAGKQQRIARSFLTARDGAEALKQAKAAEREAERQRLEGRLFRQPASTATSENIARQASYRDALARAAEKVASSKDQTAASRGLQEMLDLAHLTGDDLQAQAVIAVAVRESDLPTLNAYVSKRPDIEADLQAFINLMDPQLTAESLVEGFSFVVQRPEELRQVHDHQLAQVAETAPAQPLSPEMERAVQHQKTVQEFTEMSQQNAAY